MDIYSPTMFIAALWDGAAVLAEGVGRSSCRHQAKNICVCLCAPECLQCKHVCAASEAFWVLIGNIRARLR